MAILALAKWPSDHRYILNQPLLTALAFVAEIDDPDRFRRSRDAGAYLGLVPRRYQSGEIDYTGGISKCSEGRLRTLFYEGRQCDADPPRCLLPSQTGCSRFEHL